MSTVTTLERTDAAAVPLSFGSLVLIPIGSS